MGFESGLGDLPAPAFNVCPVGTYLSASVCAPNTATPIAVPSGGILECPANTTLSGQFCVSTSGQTWSGAQCNNVQSTPGRNALFSNHNFLQGYVSGYLDPAGKVADSSGRRMTLYPSVTGFSQTCWADPNSFPILNVNVTTTQAGSISVLVTGQPYCWFYYTHTTESVFNFAYGAPSCSAWKTISSSTFSVNVKVCYDGSNHITMDYSNNKKTAFSSTYLSAARRTFEIEAYSAIQPTCNRQIASLKAFQCEPGDAGPTLVGGVSTCQPPNLETTPTTHYSCVDADGQGVVDQFVAGTSNAKCRPDAFSYSGGPDWSCPVATGDPAEIISGVKTWSLVDVVQPSGPSNTPGVTLAINNDYAATGSTACQSGYSASSTLGICQSASIASTTAYSCNLGDSILSGSTCGKLIGAAHEVPVCNAGQLRNQSSCYDVANGSINPQWYIDYKIWIDIWIDAGGNMQSSVPLPSWNNYWICPSGYVTDVSLGFLFDMNPTCVRYSAPSTMQYSQTFGSCVIAGYGNLTLSGTSCYSKYAGSPYQSCQSGYSYIGNNACVIWGSGAVSYSCSSGGYVSGSTCVKPKTCPAGETLLFGTYCSKSTVSGVDIPASANCSYTPPNTSAIYSYTSMHCSDQTHVLDATGMYCVPPKTQTNSILSNILACETGDVLSGASCTPALIIYSPTSTSTYSCDPLLPAGTAFNATTMQCTPPELISPVVPVSTLVCGSNANLNTLTGQCDFISIPALNVGGQYTCPALYTVGVGAQAGWCIPTGQWSYPAAWNLIKYTCPDGGTLGLNGSGQPNGLCYMP